MEGLMRGNYPQGAQEKLTTDRAYVEPTYREKLVRRKEELVTILEQTNRMLAILDKQTPEVQELVEYMSTTRL